MTEARNASPPPLPNALAAAERMARQGGYAALVEVVYLITQIFGAAYNPNTWFTHPYYTDAWVRLDVVIVLLLGAGLFTRNRPLTGILFIAAAVEPLYLFSETQSTWRLLLQAVFFLFYARGFVGVFRYHYIAGSPGLPLFGKIIIGAVIVLLAPLLVLGILVQSQSIPETATLTGEELAPNVHEFLQEYELVEPDEVVMYAYFGGLFSFTEDGNILTDRRAISYAELDSDDPFYAAVPYDEIESVDVEYGDWITDTVVVIQSPEWEELLLYFSAETSTDRDACEYLLARTQ